ncbi:MAG: tRNA (adenosine(37)-N6)-threonylcarbamoyltransferase complex dimerization subunit type 1 TsaB [Ignavibacteria bacterium]|nr:tRNA (adenosine(37)-N6)-threonylcarbamoyltransferase complex dimerization subunit type 1 TsaB [Ignavibacteria bacterium]
MKILYLDTSSRISEIALTEGKKILFHRILNDSEGADQLVYRLKLSFSEINLKPDEINNISLSAGPGSFTGLRIGLAVAKGIALVCRCGFIGVPSLDILANIFPSSENLISLIPSNPKKSEFYYAKYKKNNSALIRNSEYSSGNLNDILKNDSSFIIKKEYLQHIPESERKKIFSDYPEKDVMGSQIELTLKNISENNFSDIENFRPEYVENYVPKN